MKAIVTVIGKDNVGIIAKVSGELSRLGANIEDISQTLLQDYFVMIMLADISGAGGISKIGDAMYALGEKVGVTIRVQHEDVFNVMHKI